MDSHGILKFCSTIQREEQEQAAPPQQHPRAQWVHAVSAHHGKTYQLYTSSTQDNSLSGSSDQNVLETLGVEHSRLEQDLPPASGGEDEETPDWGGEDGCWEDVVKATDQLHEAGVLQGDMRGDVEQRLVEGA